MGTAKCRKIVLLLVIACSFACAEYQIGVGIADCTGPAAGIVFMGYAKPNQKGEGLHLRQFARAFILDDNNHRIAFVTVDGGMIGHGLRREILKQLDVVYPGIYTEQNLVLSGTHTHGTPGGYLMEVLFDISCLGFQKETFDALVNGIIRAIRRAHENMVIGKVYSNRGELLDANINRSPTAYLRNPEEERAKYKYDVDKELTQLKFVQSKEDSLIGVLNWFPVHATSMNNTNHLVTSDNVGYASILLEKRLNNNALPGKGKIVAAFASSNLGDASPNTNGGMCIDTGKRCDTDSSTCLGDAKKCIASGPGRDMFESTEIIATKLYKKAMELLNDGDAKEVTGALKSVHQFVDMPKQKVMYDFGNGTIKEVSGCISAMGYSFAAGTTDGPGEFDFRQGTVSPNKFWNYVRDFLASPTPEDEECHSPKPILLATGRMHKPYEWQPQIVPMQIVFIGNFVIVAVPGEFTTMSGRRLVKVVRDTAILNGAPNNTEIVVAGLSNMYTDYIATTEEYQMQRYEGASTIYGPYTLPIYLKVYEELTEAVLQGTEGKLESGPSPPDFSTKLISFVPPVILDLPGYDYEFGSCIAQPPTQVRSGTTVAVKFVSAHPRNNVMQERSFLTIEKEEDNGWKIVFTDASWETRFIWNRTKFASSEATVEWLVTKDVEPGTYRIRHFGYWRSLLGGTHPFQGQTRSFSVVQ